MDLDPPGFGSLLFVLHTRCLLYIHFCLLYIHFVCSTYTLFALHTLCLLYVHFCLLYVHFVCSVYTFVCSTYTLFALHTLCLLYIHFGCSTYTLFALHTLWPHGYCARLRIERSGFEPWPGTLCCVLGQNNSLSQCLSPPRCRNGYRRT